MPSPIPRPGVALRVVLLEQAEEADNEREDGEREQVKDGRSEQQRNLTATLCRRGIGRPATRLGYGAGALDHLDLSRQIPPPSQPRLSTAVHLAFALAHASAALTDPLSAPANSWEAIVINSNVSGILAISRIVARSNTEPATGRYGNCLTSAGLKYVDFRLGSVW